MVDLGVYNFVKNALAAGKSREDITADLARGGSNAATIEEALAAVQSGTPPVSPKARHAPVIDIGITSRAPSERVQQFRGFAIALKLALLFAVIGGIAFYMMPRVPGLQAKFQEVREKYETGRQHVPGDPIPPASTQ